MPNAKRGIFRASLIRLCQLAQELDYQLTRLVHRLLPHRYVRSGSCGRSGVCCRSIGVMAPAWVFRSSLAMRIVQLWYEQVNEFYLKHIEAEDAVFVFGCPYLKDNQCSRHASRPPICRAYPSATFFMQPTLFPTCGYRFSAKARATTP